MRAALALLGLATAACQPATEILLGFATDLRAPGALDEVRLEVSRAGTDVPQQMLSWPISGTSEPFGLPGSFGVVADDGLPIEVSLMGLVGGEPVVERRALLTLLDGETLFYRLGLTTECRDRVAPCPSGTTCVEGVCEAAEIDPRLLPDFDDALVEELTCVGPVTYLDTSTGEPMPLSADATECPYILCAEGTCLDLPPGAHLFRGVCDARSSFELLIDGAKAGLSLGFDRAWGTASAREFEVTVPIDGRDVLFRGTFDDERVTGVGIETAGSFRCDAFADAPRRYCGTFTRADGRGGRVAFVRAGDQLFGQYASPDGATPVLLGSLDGLAPSGGDDFALVWRNEPYAGVVIESGTATATVTGDAVTGTITGSSAGLMTGGSFTADAASCVDGAGPATCVGGCADGQACVNGTCVGTGELRVTLQWEVATDVDLHVRTPSGAEISFMSEMADSGTLDVDDTGMGNLVENVFFTAPLPGTYEIWAHNYVGTMATPYTLTVTTPAGEVLRDTGELPAMQVDSEHVFYVHGAGARGAGTPASGR